MNKILKILFILLLIISCYSKTNNSKVKENFFKRLGIFSFGSKEENVEFKKLKKEIENFVFPVLSDENIKKFVAVNKNIDNFIKKYPNSKKIKILEEYKSEFKEYFVVIQKYQNLKNSKTIYELDGNIFDWNIFKDSHENENVGKLMKNSKKVIEEIYSVKSQNFEKERLKIVDEMNKPKFENSNNGIKKNNEKNLYFENCKEAKAKGYKNIKKGQSGYSEDLDKDGDGIACESK